MPWAVGLGRTGGTHLGHNAEQRGAKGPCGHARAGLLQADRLQLRFAHILVRQSAHPSPHGLPVVAQRLAGALDVGGVEVGAEDGDEEVREDLDSMGQS